MSPADRRSTPGQVGDLSYLAWPGAADALPILYLHPVNTAAAVWTSVAERIGPQRPAVAVDYRAHGHSDPGGHYLPADYATDALAVLDAAGIDSAHVVCGSIGGAISVELAARAPERVSSITAFGATLRLGWSEAVMADVLADLRTLGVREWFVRHGAGILGPRSAPDAADRLVELASGARNGDRDLDVVVDVLRSTFQSADSRPAARLVRPAPPPSLVVVGTHDPTCPRAMADELADVLGAHVQVMPGIGHLPMLEDPAGTAEAVLRSIRDSERGSR